MFQQIQIALSQPLPGEQAHRTMWPESRNELLKIKQTKDPVQSSVVALFYPIGGITHLCFIKRATDNSHHSSQIAFPGGKMEKEDDSFLTTALRECFEELGVEIKPEQIAGEVTPLYIPISNFMVHTFVAVLDARPTFKKSDAEVDEILEIPFEHLLKTETRSSFELSYENQNYTIPCLRFNDHRIWGATAMILSEILFLLKSI